MIPLPSKWIIQFGEAIYRRARFGRRRRSHDRVQHHRPGAGDDSADSVRTAHAATERFLLAAEFRPTTTLCHVFWALAVILLAFAGFTVIVVRLRRPYRRR